jgi:hypothetical protein
MTPKDKKKKLIKLSIIGVILYYFLSKSTSARSANISTNQTATDLKKLILQDPEVKAALRGATGINGATGTNGGTGTNGTNGTATAILQNFHFNADMDFNILRNYVSVFVDPINGIDGLSNELYYTTAKFKTLKAASVWVNTNQRGSITIRVENTTAENPLLLTERIWINDKLEVNIVGVGNQFLDCNGFDISYLGSIGAIGNLTIQLRRNYDIRINSNGEIKFYSCIINMLSTVTQAILATSATVIIESGVVVNFSANGQVLLHPSGGGRLDIITTNHTPAPIFNLVGINNLASYGYASTLRTTLNPAINWNLNIDMVTWIKPSGSNPETTITSDYTMNENITVIIADASNAPNNVLTVNAIGNLKTGKEYIVINKGSVGNISLIFPEEPINYVGFTNQFVIGTRSNNNPSIQPNTNIFTGHVRFIKVNTGIIILGNPAF